MKHVGYLTGLITFIAALAWAADYTTLYEGGPIGGTTPGTGAFTTVAANAGITLTDADGAATISAIAASGAYDASLVLDSDAGEDNGDTWTVSAKADDNDLSILNHTTERAKLTAAGALHVDAINELGSSGVALEGLTLDDGAYTDADGSLTISNITLNGSIGGMTMAAGAFADADGALTISNQTLNGVFTMSNGEKFDNATADGHVMFYCDSDESIIFEVRSPNNSDGEAEIRLVADAASDNADQWRILNDANDSNWLEFDNYTSGSFANKARLSTAGVLEVDTINELGSSGVTVETVKIDDGIITLAAQTAAISTNAYTLTPTTSFVQLYPDTVTTITLANATSAGQILEIVNMVGTNAVIADSANVESTGAITLGQYDTARFIGIGTNWAQFGASDN